MSPDTVLLNTLERSRKDLLDLSTRNRLIHTTRSRSRSSRLEIVGETSADVFQQLVLDRKAMTFDPIPAPPNRSGEEASGDSPRLFQPEEEESTEVVGVQGDTALQTSLTSEQLQKRLLKIYYDARTYEEEQGVGILYLAVGYLKWFEDDRSDVERFAPLLLIPVRLDRQSASAKFRLRFTEDEISTNLSLQARLKSDFGINLPEVLDAEELTPDKYFESVRAAVQTKARWEVLPNDMVLWFFSFAKFLMFRDLGGESWPEGKELDQRPLLQKLLRSGFGNDPPLCDEEQQIDELIPAADLVHVVDADSSQTIVIEEAKRGRNLVIQGPPGTGKSQTIANLICGAVKAGKKVLFVAEKMAALDVVHSRLQRAGLGEMCLELHSSKANKRVVLDHLKTALELGAPRVGDVGQVCRDLETSRERLNGHLRVLHSPVAPSQLTPFQLVGDLVRLRAQGIAPCSFHFADSLKWSQRDFQTRLDALRDLAGHVTKMGDVQRHPWRGVGLDVVLPMDADRLQAKLPAVLERLERLERCGTELAVRLRVAVPLNALTLSSVARLAKRLAVAPPLDHRSLAHPVWSQQREAIDQLVAAGCRLAEHRAKLVGIVCDAGWEVEVGAARRALAAHGRSWFRLLYPSYGKAQTVLAGLLVGAPPRKLEERLAILDSLIAVQKAEKSLADEANAQLGAAAFGRLWKGAADSDWRQLRAITVWETESREAKLDFDFRAVLAALDTTPDVAPLLKQLSGDFKPALDELKQLFESLKLQLPEAFGQGDLNAIPWSELRSCLQAWREHPEGLSSWVLYFGRSRRLAQEGFQPIIALLQRGELAVTAAVATAEMAHYEVLLRSVWRQNPELAAFHGEAHEQTLEKFKLLDSARIQLAREEVARAHYDGLPSSGAESGAVGLVRREIEKKRRHMSIRQLLAKAGPAVQAMKPVFLMSPISVAQYLEPGLIDFDLLVIDEASQVQPVDALGAAARAQQIVVVGDSKQLPPSRFFSRMLGEDDAEETPEDEVSAGDVESVLGLCCAQGVPQRMLRWHYRSRHHSLIAVSNREFYDNRLYVFPSPGATGPQHGLSLHYVADGVFDRGGSATNRIEARAVAQAVMEHARLRPAQTLGVGCFSVSQRDAVLDELELLRREDPSLESFFMASAEPFFVKNLENIQGDERDVILISVGYARNAEGYMAMNFGPLATDGGERRLNVLITRARDCCRVFSSIRADDIDLNRARSRGAQAFKTFLKYADTGLLDSGASTGREHDSEFERQVAVALTKHGYQIEPQVGVAGFFIDLAVIDPNKPGRYVLGIECDGASYHRSRSARDRDRLRSAVLESRGWTIHRVWSTDWFHRPDDELRKLLAAIHAAVVPTGDSCTPGPQTSAVVTATTAEIVREAPVVSDSANSVENFARPYVVASFRVQTSSEIHEVPTLELARIVTQVVEIEGPVHEEELARRISQLWGLQRAGSRIKEAVGDALVTAGRSGLIAQQGPFVSLPAQVRVPVRNRAEVSQANLRKIEMLPPTELRQAALAIIEAHVGIAVAEVVTEVAELLGFGAISKQLRQAIEQEITELVRMRIVEDRFGNLFECRVEQLDVVRKAAR